MALVSLHAALALASAAPQARTPSAALQARTPAAPPATRQAYAIALDGEDVGSAELLIAWPGRRYPGDRQRRFGFEWQSEFVVSGDLCLRSEERRAGEAGLDESPLPEELFVALAPELGAGCRQLAEVAADANGGGPLAPNGGCWQEANAARAVGTLFGEPLEVTFGPNLLPRRVRYPALGLSYRAIAERPEAAACSPTVADRGVVANGGAAFAARRLQSATYAFGAAPIEVRAPGPLPMPAKVRAALLEVRAAGLRSCQASAEALRRQLATTLAPSPGAVRTVAGLLLDQGRWYPHAWNEVRLSADGPWLPLDATTGDRWADAGRLTVGPLSDLATGLQLLALLHKPPKVIAASEAPNPATPR